MNKSEITYMKREFQKVLPVFILAVLNSIYIFGRIYMTLAHTNEDLWVMLTYLFGSYTQGGDLFTVELLTELDGWYIVSMVILELLLIQRVFYLENRADISEFLRILPIRETRKAGIKLFAGEMVLLGNCIMFGIIGTITNAMLYPGLKEVNEVLLAEDIMRNSYGMLWSMAAIMFLAMSAVFIVLFLVQCCVHSIPLALLTGSGILYAPYYYAWSYRSLTERRTGYTMTEMASSLLQPYYYRIVYQNPDGGGEMANIMRAEGISQGKDIVFLVTVIIIALICLAIALHFRWNIRESNLHVINSPGVREFLITGVSVTVGTAVARFDRMAVSGNMSGWRRLFGVALISTLVVWIIFHTAMGLSIRRRRVVKR